MANILKSFFILIVFSLCINTNLKAQATAEDLIDAFSKFLKKMLELLSTIYLQQII